MTREGFNEAQQSSLALASSFVSGPRRYVNLRHAPKRLSTTMMNASTNQLPLITLTCSTHNIQLRWPFIGSRSLRGVKLDAMVCRISVPSGPVRTVVSELERLAKQCLGAKPCKNTKIAKGELRLGAWVKFQDNGSFKWRHWGCERVLPPARGFGLMDSGSSDKVITNLKTEYKEPSDLDGYDELP